ncbi:hypothetical protein OTU49_006681 [Cherax quadricarinatus]|uniref:Monocarboxylate transporter n=1 Tax=Cherax quadricarinatus TaxID=27406 RepID=A0AAW0YM28_CHEQU
MSRWLLLGWLGGLSTSVALLVSPITIGVCRRNSTRLTAVLGGLITALGCLFTSFASQFHQLFFSYGTVIGIGVGMTRDSSTLMVGQYFKRRREFVEIIVVSGSGLGISVMSVFIRGAIDLPVPPSASGHPPSQEPEEESKGEEPAGRQAAFLRCGHPQEPYRPNSPRLHRTLFLRHHYTYNIYGAPSTEGGPGRGVSLAATDVPGTGLGHRVLRLRLRGAAEEHRMSCGTPVPLSGVNVPVWRLHSRLHRCRR